uniref:AlNc14C903G12618 protein n=1 Tax=Albugo laibachii Nc14 TaxID=890382 RepID=F0X289_9STRA|nr:AlNc14C903G12618 [Albugo laibachii Nc14]|eukprot:CCA27968.1 AlNc14C903G12618 [Albugo laibachii Nc14]
MKKAAWNTSTNISKPAPRSSIAKRVGGGYAPVAPVGPTASTRTTRTGTAQRTTSTAVTCVGSGRISQTARMGFPESTQPRPRSTLRRNAAEPTAIRVGGGAVLQENGNLASQSLVDEVKQLKAKNTELTTALKEKTTQLEEASQKVSKLNTTVRKINKRLEATQMKTERCQSELKDVLKAHDEDKKKLQHLMVENKQLRARMVTSTKSSRSTEATTVRKFTQVKERSCREGNVQHQATGEVSNAVIPEEKEGANRFNGNARMIEDILAEERLEQSTLYAQLETTGQHSEMNRSRVGWNMFQDLMEEEKSDQCPLFDELQKLDQLTVKERNQVGWDLFEEFTKKRAKYSVR